MDKSITVTDISGQTVVRRPQKHSRAVGISYAGGDLPEAYDTRVDYTTETEKDMWDMFEELAYHTDFGSVFREAYVSNLFPPFHFESVSGKHEDVQAFWEQHNMDTQLRMVIDQAATFGTGVGQYTFVGGEKRQLLNMRRLDTMSLKLEKDSKGIIKITQTQSGGEAKTIDTIPVSRPPTMTFFWQPFENPRSAYGWSAFRPVVHNIKGLSDLGKDIFAAIKNLAYTQRVFKLDLRDANSVDEKDEAIKETTKFFDRFESATNSVLVFENTHDYGFAGAVGGQTASGQRLQSLMPIIEPVLSVALMRFKIALGHFEQADASRQILKEQEEAMERAIQPQREELKNKILNEIVPRILALEFPEKEEDWKIIPEHDIKLVWDIGMPSDIRDKIDVFSLGIEYGLVTPRYASEQCGFTDLFAKWDANGFLVKSEMEVEAQKEGIAAAKAAPEKGVGSSVASKQDARRNVRNKKGAN